MKATISLQTETYFSRSKDLSFLQKEYQSMFSAKCNEHGVDHPFELDDEKVQQFFAELSADWKARKVQLYKQNKIEADQL